ncbi:MAG: filamentous hemagglutinin family protein [Gammaproteobacteria bacterium]|jgi:filamentous hemagglutinin family protein
MKNRPSRLPEAARSAPNQGLRKRLQMRPAAEQIRRVLFPGLVLGLQVGAAVAGPQGGTVVGGSGNISRQNDRTTVIQQQSQNLAIDWQKFDVRQNEVVQFNQPGRNAQALNRIFDQNASQIHGRINANGRVLLMNPNGVIFGPNAHVNVNGLVAAGMKNISVDDFMAGKFKLEGLDGADGAVVNHGILEAATGGDVTLVGKTIQNDGIIIASAGRVNLAAGNQVTLDFDGDGLMRFAVDEAVLKNATALDDQVTNSGTLEANGGAVVIAASAARGVFTNAINNTGLIRAARIENVGGVIRLAGMGPSASVLNTGTIDASAPAPGSGGGYVDITGANIRQAGVVRVDAIDSAGHIAMQATRALELGPDSTTSAVSSTDSGGEVRALGSTVTLKAGAAIDVSGAAAGGVALVGGDEQGANPNVVNAQTTIVEEGAAIIADATANGDGGTVVVWSDGTTTFDGAISARGGAAGGNGGFAEASGREHIVLNGYADMRAPNGDAGSFVADPGTIILCAFSATCGSMTLTGPDRFSDNHITTQLGLGDFTILTSAATTANGIAEDIIVVDPGFAVTWAANALTLTAGRDVTLDGSFMATGTAALTLTAGRDLNLGGSISTAGAATLNLNFGASNLGGILDLSAASLSAANPITASGGTGSDTIVGPNITANWSIAGASDGSITWTVPSAVTVDFTAADVLTGGTMADTFNIGASFAGALNGGAGADNFIFADAATVTSTIDGGVDSDLDTIDWSAYTTDRDVTLSGLGAGDGFDGDEASITSGTFTNIDALVGRSAGATPNNILRGANLVNAWGISTPNAGSISAGGVALSFTDFETIAGGSAVDTFALTGTGTIQTISDASASAADNTLAGGAADNVWSLTDNNRGALTGVVTAFSNIGNLVGNALSDSFQLSGASTFSGSIDGQGSGVGDSDEINWSAYGSVRDVTLSGSSANGFAGADASITLGFTNIDTLVGNSAGGSTLTGYNTATNWTLVGGLDDGNLVAEARMLDFTDFSNWIGNAAIDTFNVNDVAVGDDLTGNLLGGAEDDSFILDGIATIGGTIQGGADGTNGDLVVGPNLANTWNINAASGGDLGGGITFTQIENVAGGSNDDTFVLTATANVFLDGNANGINGDTIDWSGFGTAANVVLNSNAANGFGSSTATGLSGFQDVDVLEGDGSSALQGIAAGGVFNIDGIAATTNTYVSTGTLSFEGFSNLAGSATSADSFVFAAAGFSAAFVIHGGGTGVAAGTINLSADPTDRTYSVTAPNAGNASGVAGMVFSNVGNLTAGGGDALNFSTLAPATLVTVDLAASTALGALSGAFSGFDVFTGHGANATLHAPNGGVNVDITASNTGTIGTTSFTAFANLESGDGGDAFRFVGATANVAGTITGDAATGATLDYSMVTTAATVNLAAASASLTGGVSDITAMIGVDGDDVLHGDDTANVFNITGADSGDIDGAVTFTGFSFLEAGTGGDMFRFDTVAGALSGTITGNTGTDVLDYSLRTGGDVLNAMVNLDASSASQVTGGFTSIEAVIGDGANDTLMGANGASNTFNLIGGDGTDDGNVNGTFAFTDFTDLQAGTSGDTFAFNGANVLSGAITGDGAASDTLDYVAATGGPLTFTVGGAALRVGSATDIDIFVGTAAVDTLNGTAGIDTFTIDNLTANNDVHVGGITYLGIENITGLTGADIFNVTGDHTGNLSGGSEPDTFNFGLAGETPVLTGQLDGGLGAGDVVDFTNYGSPATATITGANRGDIAAAADPVVFGGDDYIDIEDARSVGIHGADGVNHDWLITGLNAVTLDATSTFTDVAFIVGGNLTDNFAIENDGVLVGSIDGGAGSDFLIADPVTDAAATFAINAPDTGTITVGSGTLTTSFMNIENLTGSDVNDQFNFSGTGSVSEIISGGGSAGADVVVLAGTGLASYTATIDGAAFGIANVNQIIGNGTSGLVLAGGVLFTITGSDSGTADGAATTGITFTDWADLAGTAGVDTFDFNSGDISGTVDGLGGADVVDFENHDVNISVTLSALGSTDGFQGTSSDIGGFDNIDDFKARSVGGADSLIGLDAVALWTIDATAQYASTNTLNFSNFEALAGGLAADSFSLADTFAVAMIDGGTGAASVVDTLNLSAYSTALNWTISGNGGGSVDTTSPTAFVDFEAFIGGAAVDAFNVTADTGLLDLFGPNPGNVDGGAGATNTLSFAGRTTDVIVELDNVSNITAITGGTSSNDLITGTSAADTIATNGVNSGSFSGGIALTYAAFENVGGGGNDDVLNVEHDVSGAVRGDAGLDEFNLNTAGVTVTGGLLGGADADTFNIRASVSAAVDGEAGNDIVNVDPLGTSGIVLTGNVSGGANNDTVNVGLPTLAAPAGSTSTSHIIGQIDGGGGTDTFDYTGTNHGMLVTVTGSGVGGDNIEFSGASVVTDFAIGDDVININTVTDNRLGTLLGPNEDTTWRVNATNSGTFQGASAGSATGFTNFQIVGRGFVDTFIFENGGKIVGLEGGPGVVGGGGIDTVVVADVGLGGPTSESFIITASDEGTITTGAGVTAFDLIDSLVGNDGTGTVLAQAIWNGSIDGGTGGTDLQFDGASGGQSAVLTADGTAVGFQGTTAPIVGGFDNVTIFTNPIAATKSLAGGDQDTTWNLLGTNSGTVASIARTLTYTNFNNLIGGSDVDIFNVTANHSGNLTGNGGADQFVFTNAAVLSGSINGSAGSDTLDYATYGGVVTVTILGSGTTDGFRGNELAATSISGTFDEIDQILAENGGGDTLVAPNATNLWTITGANVFTLDSGGSGPVGFTNFANLTGGLNADTFNFTTGNITGALDGRNGVNTLSYAGNAGVVSVILTGIGTSVGFGGTATGIGATFDSITDLIGSANTDSLSGLNSLSIWTLDGTNYQTLARQLNFTGTGVNAIENLNGGSAADIFNITASRVGDIDGGDGSNRFNLSGPATVVTGNLLGGAGADQFNFSDAASITGTLDGGVGLGSLDWSGSTVTASFEPLGAATLPGGIQGNLAPLIATTGSGFDNINNITTNNFLSVFVGNDDDTTWTIDGPNAFTVTSLSVAGIAFTNFGSIIAGTGADDFRFAGGSLSGTIDGGGGANRLRANNVANLWTLTGATAGSLTGLGGSFTNINDISGGANTDRFTVIGASSFAGQVSGALGINTVVGGNVANNWDLTGANQGNIGGLTSFLNVSRLEGGSGADTFNFSSTSNFGGLDAGAGNDILNYAGVTGPVSVNLATGVKSLIADGSGLNFEQIIGTSAGSDTFIGANANNNWNISGIGSGTVGGVTFSAFENLTGGSAIDNFSIGAANRVTGNLNGGPGADTISQPFASNWRTAGLNAGTTNGVVGTFTNVENLTAQGTLANLIIDGGSLLGTYTATTVTLDADGTSATAGAPIKIAAHLVANASQSINTGGGMFSVSDSLTGNGAAYTINASSIIVGGMTNASSVNFTSANSRVGAVTTTGSQIYNGATNFSGNLDGGNMVFNGPSTFNGDVLLRSTTDITDFNGPVSGTGNLDIIPTANTDIFIGNDSGPGSIAASQFSNFQGHLIVGALLNPLDSPAEQATVVNPPGVTANLIVVGQDFAVGGEVTLIGHNINLEAGISAAATGQVTLVAVGDTSPNGEGPGDITGPASGAAVIGGGKAVLIANNAVLNPNNIRFDLNNGDLLLAVSANEDEPVFDSSSNANSVDFDPLTLAIIAGLGLNLQSVQVVFSNPASALTGLQNVQFIDAGLFEDDLSLFGVIGNGIAMSLDQCEEAEGCAPNITGEEIDSLTTQLESRIAEIEKRSANGVIDAEDGARLLGGFRQELDNFQTYKQQLADYNASQQDFTDEFGEIDEFAEEFDDTEFEPDERFDNAGPLENAPSEPANLEAPRLAAPEPLPELEPAEEAFEELDDDFIEQEVPVDEFDDLDEEFEEIVPLEDLEDEFEEFEEFEEIGLKIRRQLLPDLVQAGDVNQYRGVIDLAHGRVIWTGDIVLPSFARNY